MDALYKATDVVSSVIEPSDSFGFSQHVFVAEVCRESLWSTSLREAALRFLQRPRSEMSNRRMSKALLGTSLILTIGSGDPTVSLLRVAPTQLGLEEGRTWTKHNLQAEPESSTD